MTPIKDALMALTEDAMRHGFEGIAPELWADHLPPTVLQQLLKSDAIVFPVPSEYSDTAAFCEHFHFGLEDSANTLVVRYTKEGREHHAAIVALATRRLDMNGTVRRYLGAQRLTFAKREVATELTGMEFGGITAFGLPNDMPILVDKAVMSRPYVVMGAGFRRTKVLIQPSVLTRLSGVQIAELSGESPA